MHTLFGWNKRKSNSNWSSIFIIYQSYHCIITKLPKLEHHHVFLSGCPPWPQTRLQHAGPPCKDDRSANWPGPWRGDHLPSWWWLTFFFLCLTVLRLYGQNKTRRWRSQAFCGWIKKIFAGLHYIYGCHQQDLDTNIAIETGNDYWWCRLK